ncbi:MAG: RNA-binding S4 domain-containing protein [Verrucomicrobiales bacterium]
MPAESVRADKWLWAVRLAKTRGIAAEWCAAAKVKRAGHPIKAATPLRPGDVVELPFAAGPGTRVIEVKGLIDKRVGAPEARECYDDRTPSEMFEAQDVWRAARKEGVRGRPTKKNRRDIDRIHGFWD